MARSNERSGPPIQHRQVAGCVDVDVAARADALSAMHGAVRRRSVWVERAFSRLAASSAKANILRIFLDDWDYNTSASRCDGVLVNIESPCGCESSA